MKFMTKMAVALLATGALLAPSIAPAQAAYPPALPVISASSVLTNGYADVKVEGLSLSNSMKVTAAYGAKSASGTLTVDAAGTTGKTSILVAPLLPKTAGRYPVSFNLVGTSVYATSTYTVGTPITIKSFKVTRKAVGLKVTGKAIRGLKVKVTVKLGSRSQSKTVSTSKSGNFSWTYHGTKKGTYVVSAKIIPTTKYFGAATAVKTYVRK